MLSRREISRSRRSRHDRLDGVTGSLTVAGERVTINDLAGHHGSAEADLSGTGSTDPSGPWIEDSARRC